MPFRSRTPLWRDADATETEYHAIIPCMTVPMSDTLTGTLKILSNFGPLLSNQDSPLVCLDLGYWPIAWSGAVLVTEIVGSAEPRRSAMRKVPILLVPHNKLYLTSLSYKPDDSKRVMVTYDPLHKFIATNSLPLNQVRYLEHLPCHDQKSKKIKPLIKHYNLHPEYRTIL